MADDYITATTKQIVALLGANTLFAKSIALGNRLTKLTGVRYPRPVNLAARNVPFFEIDIGQERTSNRNAAQTFTNVKSAVGDVVVIEEHQFQIVIVWDGFDRTLPNQIATVMRGVLLADPRLGLTTPIIRTSGVNMSTRYVEENTSRTGGTNRLVSITTFPVTFELHRADLVAAATFTGA